MKKFVRWLIFICAAWMTPIIAVGVWAEEDKTYFESVKYMWGLAVKDILRKDIK